MKEQMITCEECKEAFRAVLPLIPIPPRNRKMLLEAGCNLDDDPYNGHCAKATEAAYVLCRRKADLKPFKNLIKGRGSHYWLANPEKGRELDFCDLIVFERNYGFCYKQRRRAGWISKRKTREDLTKEGRRIYDAVIDFIQRRRHGEI